MFHGLFIHQPKNVFLHILKITTMKMKIMFLSNIRCNPNPYDTKLQLPYHSFYICVCFALIRYSTYGVWGFYRNSIDIVVIRTRLPN